MKCRSSSDDLNCYEFTGGFTCDLDEGHPEPHRSEVAGYAVEWRKLPDNFVVSSN